MNKSSAIEKRARHFVHYAVLLAASIVFFAGCTHNLRIVNSDDLYPPPAPLLKEPLKLGVTSNSDIHPQNRRYVAAIVDALQKNASVSSVVYPYSQAVHKDTVDAVVDITIHPRYDGQRSNFWVNFPGFLIFAPAVWGYGYSADLETMVSIKQLKSDASQQMTIPCTYKFRQAAINRTWTEVGWLEIGIIPLVGGFAFTGYDPKVTDEFITKVSPYYGPYVATKIISAFSQNQPGANAVKQ